MLLRWLCGVLLALLSAHGAFAKTVTVASAEWQDMTAFDGSGIYFQVLREALATQDIDIQVRVSNWKRAKQMFFANRVDVLLADYQTQAPTMLFPRWHIDTDPAIVLFTVKSVSDLQELAGQTIGWTLGYDFDKLLPVSVVGIEVEKDSVGFDLLAHHRLDGFIGYANNLPLSINQPFKQHQLMPPQKLFPVFHQNFEGRLLAGAFDRGMAELNRSGRLQQIFGRYYARAHFPK